MSSIDLTATLGRALDSRDGPLYRRIADALAAAIETGEAREGDRLPPQRHLAGALGVDLTTITRAFAEARRRGLIEATVGRGTFVRSGAQGTQWRDAGGAVVDLAMNLPPLPDDPSLRHLIQSDMAALMQRQNLAALLSYRVTGGTAEERALAGKWLLPVLGPRDAGEILVVPGAQAAMTAVVSTLTRPGDVIVTDRLTYPGMRALAAQFGLSLRGVEGDEEGMVPDALARACQAHRPRLIYCTPTIHNPTTATMSIARRRAILAVAQAHDLPILEDDPYNLLLDAPFPALARLDPSRVYYVSTLAKVLSPALRQAYLIAPGREATRRITSAVRAVCLTNSGLTSSLVAHWMQSGSAHAILRAIQGELKARQACAAAILGPGHAAAACGPHLWLTLPEWWSSVDFVAQARREGMALVSSTVFTVEGAPPQRVRVALGCAATMQALAASLNGIAALLRQKRAPGFDDIV